MPAQKSLVVQKLRHDFSLSLLLSIAQLPRATFYYHLKRMENLDKYQEKKSRQSTTKTKVDTAIVVLRQNCTIVDFI